MTPKSRERLERVGEKVASNDLVIYAGAILGIYIGLRLLLPDAYDWLKKGFSAGVDSIRGSVGSIIGTPSSQNPNDRGFWDRFTGLFGVGTAAGSDDRALIDDLTFSGGSTDTPQSKAYREMLYDQGYIDASTNYTQKGLDAIASKTFPRMSS